MKIQKNGPLSAALQEQADGILSSAALKATSIGFSCHVYST